MTDTYVAVISQTQWLQLHYRLQALNWSHKCHHERKREGGREGRVAVYCHELERPLNCPSDPQCAYICFCEQDWYYYAYHKTTKPWVACPGLELTAFIYRSFIAFWYLHSTRLVKSRLILQNDVVWWGLIGCSYTKAPFKPVGGTANSYKSKWRNNCHDRNSN